METETTTLRIPDNFEEYEKGVMSNFDHCIDANVADYIKGKPLFAQYGGWNFCGYVWWANDSWHCEVWVYRSWRETISAETLREIMDEVCDKYGND